MNKENLTNYLETGIPVEQTPKIYRTLIIGSGIWALLGLTPGIVLGNYWRIITMLMIGISIVATIIVFWMSTMKLTLERRLILFTIISISWFFEIALLELIVFTMTYGWQISLILLYLPNFIIPISLGMNTSKMLRKDETFKMNKITRSGLALNGAMYGLIGMNFAAIFRNLSQNIVIIALLICMLILNSIFSMGFLGFQKLYYLFKYKKSGILPKEFYE